MKFKVAIVDLELTRKQKGVLYAGLAGCLAMTAAIASADVPHTFVAGSTLKASELNQNFDDVETRLDALEGLEAPGAIPAGVIAPYAGEEVPAGWLLCDGAEVSRVDNADLFAAIGVTYGAGDSVNTFDLPDLRGRVALGSGAGPGLTDRVPGAAGGGETATLTVSNLPAHSHTISDPGHAHAITDPGHNHGVWTGSGGNPWYQFTSAFGSSATNHTSNASTTGVTVNSATTGITVQNAGGGTAFSRMSPFLVATYIIKL